MSFSHRPLIAGPVNLLTFLLLTFPLQPQADAASNQVVGVEMLNLSTRAPLLNTKSLEFHVVP